MPDNLAPVRPSVDTWTLIGLVLLLSPLLTMAHELLGHALTCMAVGHVPSELGAYYVNCPDTSGWRKLVVSMAGTGVDVVVAILAYFAWRAARRPLVRLSLWIVFAVKGMVAAGYWMFSGITTIGDWGIAKDGGLGLLPHAWILRSLLTIVGLVGYIGVVRIATGMLVRMLGGREQAAFVQRKIAMTVYFVGGACAFLVSLLNPQGFVITLVSAIAASFGGTAGMFNVAFRPVGSRPPTDFHVRRHYAIVAAGIAMTLAFAIVLGPTVYLR
ncbi:MAG: hypothetical protein ABI870_07310 [Rhodanobacter sp.]